MKYGYARVSTEDQNLDLQINALTFFGVDVIFKEKVSGTKTKKPILDEILKLLNEDDTLVIWKLDRLGRVASELMKLQSDFEKKNVKLVSLTEKMDTSSPAGKLFFQICCCVAEMERNVLSERTKAGLISAREKGNVGGRRPGLSEKAKEKIKLLDNLYSEYLKDRSKATISEICLKAGVSKSTFYRYIKYKKKQ